MTSTNVSAPSLLSSLVLDADVAALLNRSYGKGVAPISAEKPAKSKLAKAKREKSEKSEKKSTDIVWIVRAPASPDANAFLAAMRIAGIRYQERIHPETGEVFQVPVFDSRVHREDTRIAVSAYQGWTNEPWGTQADRAMHHALAVAGGRDAIVRALPFDQGDRFATRWTVIGYTPRPVGARALPHRSPEAHSARWTTDGWIKGAPDAFAKIQGDLSARERAAVDEVAHMTYLYDAAGLGDPSTKDPAGYERRLLKLAKEDPSLAALVRQRPELLPTMLVLAQQRLETVRRDIATFDFSDPATVAARYETLNMRGLPTLAEDISLMHQFSKSN